ncbi:calcineurin-like phosphoesterase C-terminal domain-containing protein [Luteimonas sp. B3_2_R+30]|uniref:Calcineurin-like phosphoesterase C-terminal domain-containing protein n=2 Tax=Luteimonas salinilitoris TaxID=3237697 RepID=A0ABV4HQH2_9GAMM
MQWMLWPTLLWAVSWAVLACDAGTVGVDGDGDGRPDRSAPGVRVSDGRQVAITDAAGHWRLPMPARGPVFVIKPPAHALPRRDDGLPDFWRAAAEKGGGGCDFMLLPIPDPPEDALEVLVFADPQAATRKQVGYYLDDIVRPLQDRHRAALGVTLGDVANDDLSLYPELNRATALLGVPWLHVAGNHDLDVEATRDEDSLRTFRGVYGPDSFAWEESRATFVGLDDVIYRPGERPAYVGGLREEQFAFLEAYLPTIARDRLLVLMVHIPLFDTDSNAETFRRADRERLFALLRDFPHVLVLSGHQHRLQQYFHDADTGWRGETPLHEFNAGAASGAFWSGAADAAGIPDATMADGTPNGHATLRVFDGGAYALDWHPARLPEGDGARTAAMHLHAPWALRRGAYPAWGVYANVYMGHDDTRVEFRVDGSEWRPMRKVAVPDPWLSLENARDDLAESLRGFDRSPEAVPSTHLWRGALPTALETGEHAVEVRAFDRRYGERRASTSYRLLDATE